MHENPLEIAKADLFESAANLIFMALRYADEPSHHDALTEAVAALQEMSTRIICPHLLIN